MSFGQIFGLDVSQLIAKTEIQSVLLTAALAAAAFLVRLLFTRRGSVWWSRVANTIYVVPQGQEKSALFYSDQYYIRNSGRKEVEDLEISLNFRPQHMEIFPHIPWSCTNNPDGRQIVIFKTANKGELIILSMLSKDGECPAVTNVRFKGGTGKRINMVPQRLYTTPTLYSLGFLLIFGIGSAAYNTIRFIINYMS